MKTIRFSATILSTLWMLAQCASHSQMSQCDKLASLFSRASSVHLMSYQDRMYEAPVIEGDEITQDATEPTYFVVDELHIIENTIKEKIILNKAQRDSLFELLNADMCTTNKGAICYNPRHAIIFYDSDNQPYGYIEICFACTNHESSLDFELDFCYEKSEALRRLFHSFGIQYFTEEEL